MKKVLVWLMILAAVCSFAGCGGEKEVTLWVVTEETTWDRMNGQAWVLQKVFSKASVSNPFSSKVHFSA